MINMIKSWISKDTHGRDFYLLVVIGGLYSIGLFLSNTFVNVYLWRQTESFMTIAMYHIAIHISKPLTFYFAGNMSKKIDRIILLRLGVIFLSLFFLTVLLLQEKASYFNVLLGVLIGLGYGFYWLAFNVLTFEITEPYNRVFFNGLLGSLQSVSGMFGPLIAGIIISTLDTQVGYRTIFSISFGLFIIAVILSFFIERRETDGVYNVLDVVREVRRNGDWRRVLLANSFQGFRDSVFIFVLPIWIFLTTRNEFSLGIFNLIMHGASFFLFLLLSWKMKDNMRQRLLFLGSFVIGLSVLLLMGERDFYILLLYALIVGSMVPLFQVPFQALTYDVIGKSYRARDLRIEYIVLLEVFRSAGGILSILLFILGLQLDSGPKAIPFILCVLSFAYMLIYPTVASIER